MMRQFHTANRAKTTLEGGKGSISEDAGASGMMKLLKNAAVLFLVIMLLIWLVSIVKCEVLTNRYLDHEMMNACLDYLHAEEGSRIKVLHKGTAVVELYFLEKKGDQFIAGHVIEMAPDTSHASWVILSWDTAWVASGYGNADEIVWPYVLDRLIYS